jgi:hypothetical protein
MRLLWGILGLLLLAVPAHADTVYNVTGTATVTGNDVCSGPCIETLNFTFQIDETDTDQGFQLTLLPGGTYNSTGPLVFGDNSMPGGLIRDSYVPFGESTGGYMADEIDVYVGCFGSEEFGEQFCTPGLHDAEMYSCGSAESCAAFCPSLSAICNEGHDDYAFGGINGNTELTGEVTDPAPAPEPQTWAMLWIGLTGLALMKFAPRLKASLPLVLAAAIFAKAQLGHL